ncbi:hypothetical protein NXS98_15260 [Fontisphaera persica]|uniref:ArnT family glycosyltransferase n=1 Tax=Fontisphaera persica TaxID=2974023 RepID=UPI0024C0A483|nr:hypothetical protein [Fontisphaera persica]WCJ59057.1 hypothetical protein NXS98_15260 [Fontisphaera persica]
MSGIQEWIYHWTEGAGNRWLKFALLLMSVVALAAVYDVRAWRNFEQPAAMEQAQLGRHLARGEGYVTRSIQPLAVYLLQKQAVRQAEEARRKLPADESQWTPEQRQAFDRLLAPAQLGGPMPEIHHPPLYPLLLAGLMKLWPLDEVAPPDNRPARPLPELAIVLLNQALFFVLVWLAYTLARRLFDEGVAWLTAVVLMGTELLWRFTMSGGSTVLVMVWVLALVWCLVWLERGAEEFYSGWRMTALAALTGLVLGAGVLTRYAFAWLAVPVAVFVVAHLGVRRWLALAVTLLLAGAVVAPWLWRNYQLTGAFFGTASYVLYEGTPSFPASTLPRSLEPDFTHVEALDLPLKLVQGLRQVIPEDLPRLGGTWVSAFFLVGLLVPFRRPVLSRLRLFSLLALVLLAAAQALITSPRTTSREVSSENVLVWLTPLVIMFGVALFFTLLDQARAAVWEARPLFVGAFILVAVAPLVVKLLPPRAPMMAYPPYAPRVIQAVSAWMKPDELMMSDIPWAVAWYGQRTCIWLPLNSEGDFQAIHRRQPIHALYLTPQTLDNRFLTQWVQGENQGWGMFIAQCLLRQEVPSGFPLKHAYADLFPEQLFLTDRERWKTPTAP